VSRPSSAFPGKGRAASTARWVPPLALLGAVFLASHQPLPVHLPGPSDKLVHAAVFGLLALLWFLALRPGRQVVTAAVLAFLLATAWGALDEIHQAFVPGRHADLLDLLADAVGAGVGIVVALSWARGRPVAEEN